MKQIYLLGCIMILLVFINLGMPTSGQAQIYPNNPNDTLKSTQILNDGKVAFKIYAPKAKLVTLTKNLTEDNILKLNQNKNGVWEVISNNINLGIYKYSFNVDGISSIDPKSEQSIETYSLLTYTFLGDEFFTLQNIPHGAISESVASIVTILKYLVTIYGIPGEIT